VSRSPGPAPYRPPRPLAVWAFDHYFKNIFAKQFQTTRLGSVTDVGAWDRQVPTLCVVNHTNWWDGFYCWVATRALGLQPHVLMEAKNLARYKPFTWIGTLPMRRDSARGAWEDLQSARSCLLPGNCLWIFPQGQRRPAWERPTNLERGAAELAIGCTAPVRLVPVALRYTFLGEQNPEAFALMGQPWILTPGTYTDRRSLMARLGDELCATVDLLDDRLLAESLDDFRILVHGRLSINKRMDRVRHATGMLEGEFEARNG
jgi:hypothetical protein